MLNPDKRFESIPHIPSFCHEEGAVAPIHLLEKAWITKSMYETYSYYNNYFGLLKENAEIDDCNIVNAKEDVKAYFLKAAYALAFSRG